MKISTLEALKQTAAASKKYTDELNSRISESITEISDVVLAKSEPSANLWNPNTVVRGSIATSNGVVTEDENGAYIISDYIPINGAKKIYNYVKRVDGVFEPNTTYTIRAFFYNADKINRYSYADGAEADIPEGMEFVRLRIAYSFWVNGGKYMFALSPHDKYVDYSVGDKIVTVVRKINGKSPDKDGNLELSGESVESSIYRSGNLLRYEDIEDGYIKADGTVKFDSSIKCSGFCKLTGGIVYIKGALGTMYYAFYDENKNFLSNWQENPSVKLTTYVYYVNIPSGAKYFRCSFSTDPRTSGKISFVGCNDGYDGTEDIYTIKKAFSFEKNPDNPCDYSELTVRVFNKCVCIGDSITQGTFNTSSNTSIEGELPQTSERSAKYSYPTQFKKITGIETVNMGRGGASTASWITLFGEEDFSEFDMAVIHLGINDPSRGVDDDGTRANLTTIINMLKNASHGIKIFLCTIIPAYANIEHTDYLHKSDVIKELYNENYADDVDVILLDLQKYGHTLPYTSYVTGHLSALGYYQMAKDIASYISWHIDNNKRDYRFVQFIGSNDVYNGD